jgi:lipopolysaccharide/colanic/teichoic acid biosynthesis glycosyltransferase
MRKIELIENILVSYSGKRTIDLILTLTTAPLWFPAMLLTAALVWAKLGRPVLFRQERPGLGGHGFVLIKFRTMTDARSPSGTPLTDAERLTPFGRWLRASSLDELPELFNVLRGDMSLVGPRPLLMKYLPKFSPYHGRRHSVRPGITGLAQISGRNALSWDDRLDLDVEYVDSASPVLDIKILLRTVGTVFRRKGITAEGAATMPEFEGSTR